MADFSKMSEDELLRPDIPSNASAQIADFGAMSKEELLTPDMPTYGGETTVREPVQKPEGRALGFFERHGLESQAQTGVDLDETYGTEGFGGFLGGTAKLLNSVAPFAGTTGRAVAGMKQKALDAALESGEKGFLSGWMTGINTDEWDKTEGRKYDLVKAIESGTLGKEYEISDWVPKGYTKENRKGVRVRNTKTGETTFLDDSYAGKGDADKEEARKAYVREMAGKQIESITRSKERAQSDLANNTAAWYMDLAHGATASLGFAGEFYLGGALAKGVMGTQALAATKLGEAFQAADKGAKLGFKASAAKTAAEIAAPTLANAVARYEELTANDYGIDENGDLVLNAEGDGTIRAAAKAIGGAAFENVTEVALGKGVNLLVKNGVGGAFKGIYHRCPKVAKLFDGTMAKIGDARIDGAKKLWADAVKAYAKVQNAAHFEIMPVGEFAEEYVQGWGDEVLGFGNRATEKDASAWDFTKNFFDWDAGGKDLFFGIMGQSIALGGGAYATMRGKRLVDSVNGRVIGTLKQQGYTASDIARMSALTRIGRAAMEDPRIAQELGYDIVDLARMGGVREKDIEAFADNIKKMNADGFKSLPADEQQKVKDSVNQFAEVVYGASYAFSEGMDNAEELLSHLGKSMQKTVRLAEERQALGNYKDNRTSKVEDFTSRIDWTGTTDSAGNLNWQTGEDGRDYLESQPIDKDGNGVRIYREGDHFRVVHPHSAVTQGHRVADLKEAHDWAATMDQFAQKKNRDREVMADYIMFNAQRLVPTRTDKKMGEQYGAPVMIANNAQDVLDKFDWLSKDDVIELQNAILNRNEGGGFKTEDGTVLMLLDNLKDANDALLTLSHEIGGHLAAKEGTKAKGLSLVDTVADIFKGSSRKDAAAYKSERRIGIADGKTKEEATNIAKEEALVHGNERRMPYATPLQKAKTAVKLWLKERGMDAKLTDADFDAIAAAGLQRIRMTRTGDTGTQTVDGEGLTPTPTAQGTDMQNRYNYGKWVSDYRQQKDALDAARAATDAAEAAKRHADDAAREQAKIDQMVKDEDERQRVLAEQEQMRGDAEYATKYGREMVADVLNGWYGKKGVSAEQVNRIVESATADEIREILDYIELEMDGKASDGTVLEVSKRINADIVKRTVSEKQAAARKAFAERTAKEKAERDAAERKLVGKFTDEVQMNPMSMLAFWMKNGRKLLNHPQVKRVANKGRGAGFKYLFAGSEVDSEALNQFFDGMHGEERAKWMRIVFGENYKPAADGEVVGNDVVNQEWIAFKNGIEQNDNEAQMADDDFNDFGAMLDRLRKEYEAYEKWKAGDRLTAEEQRIKDAIDEENARIDAESAAISEAEENWGNAIAMTADGRPVKSIDELKPTDGVPIGGEHLRVVEKDGDMVKLDADDGFGTTWTARFNKEKGEWDVETQDAADESRQDRDRTEDRGDAERNGSEGRKVRDAGAVGRKSGGNGTAAEAPSDYSKVEGLTDAQKEKVASYTKSIGGSIPPIIDPITIRDFKINDEGTLSFVFLSKHYKGKEPNVEEAFSVQYISEDGFSWTDTYRGDGRIVGRNGHASGNPKFEELIADGVVSRKTVNEIDEAPSADTEGKVANASSFSRRGVDNIVFRTPFVGKTGAKLIAYSWKNKNIEEIDGRGEDRVRKISDWEESLTNPETNRDIVHHFTVVDADGKSHVVSAETAAKMLGVNVGKARGEALKQVRREMKLREVTDAQRDTFAEDVKREGNPIATFVMPNGSIKAVFNGGFRGSEGTHVVTYKKTNDKYGNGKCERETGWPIEKNAEKVVEGIRGYVVEVDEITDGNPAQSLTLDGGTAQEIAAEQKRLADRKEIERRMAAPLKTGKGETGQALMDLGGAEGEDLFNRTATEIRNAAKGEGGVKGAWRRLQDAGFKHRTEDEFVRSLREDKFADGETKKVGAQSIVYRIGDKVVKFRDVDGDVEDAVRKIEEFNKLFPNMAYTIRRETMTDNGGKMRLVLEQPYVDALPNSGTEARKQLVAALQERFGADNVKTSGDIGEKNLLAPKSWFKIDAGPWHIEDLKDLNLGIDRTDGKVKVWDAEIAYDAAKDAEGKVQGRWRRPAVTPAEDAAYMNAVKHGDMETARRIVREAAARAMPETKVVDKDGLPLVVYHSTNRKFNVFNTPSYFASTESDVKGIKGSSVNERIVPVFLDIKSPYELDAEGAKWTSIYVPHEGKSSLNNIVNGMRENGWKWYREDDVITDVDGIIVRNIKEGDIGDVYTDDYIPKSPYQIKSADPVTYDDAGNVIPLSERFNAEKDDIRWRRRTYTPNLAAQLLAEKRVLSTTDALRELKAAKDGNAALVAAEKLARELAAQGSIDPVLRDLVKATKDGTPVQIAKGNLAALASSQAFSRWREILQDAQISLKEMETKYGIKTDASAYAQFDRNYGLVKDAMDKFYREIYEPLTKELKDNSVKADDFDEYLRAKHGPERNRMIAERSPYVLTALSDKRTQTIVKDILSGARDLDDAAILDISKKLGWVDKSGNRTQESKDFEDDLRGSGATTAHWNNVLAKFAADGLTPKMLGAEKLVRELTKRNRDLLVQTGRLSADQAALWERLSPNYVPLKSDMDMDSNIWTKFLLGGGADKGGTGGRRYSDREYNHAYGRGTIADSPLSFAIQQYEDSLNRAYDNVARQKLAALVRANPNMGKVFRYLSDAERADLAKRIAILNNIAKSRALTAAEQDALTKMQDKLAEANNADKSIPTTKILGANGIMHEVPTLASIEGTKKSPTAVIAFKENGELKFIRLGGFAQDDVNKDPQKMDDVTARRIATAVKKQNMAELGEVGKKIRWLTGMFSALRTAYSPTFLISNLGADNTQAMRNIYATFGGKGALQFEKYALHAFRAAAAALSGNYGTTKIMQYAQEWAENGGKIGGLATEQIGDIQKKMARDIRRLYSQTDQLANIHGVKDFVAWANDKRHGFADLVEKMNGIVEMSTRIAAYATARDMGQSVNDAIAYSRDITVNFNRKGTATPWLNALYAFSNATMQDIHRSLIAFGEGRTGKGLGILAGRGAKMGFGLMVLGFISSMLGFWQDDPEDEREGKAQYKNAKEWQKQNVIGFRIGGKTIGVPIRGLSRIPYYLGHQVYEAMTGRKSVGKMAADTALLAIENATDFLGQASTPLNVLTPSVLRTPVDISINKTFTGQQMYREPMSNTDVRSEMGRGTTSGAAKWIARALNRLGGGNEGKRGKILGVYTDVQPEKVAEVWNWIFGSAGKDIANIAGTAKDVATGDITDRPLKNIPYLSRFIRNLDENSARYYEARDVYDAVRKEYKTLIALDRTDDAQRVLDENPWLAERGANKRWGTDLNEVKNFVSKLLELEKGAEGEDYDTIHAMRLKAQYQFMRRMEQAANEDGEGMSAERELKRKAMPFLRTSKRAKKDAERETTRAKRGLIPHAR